MAMRVRIAQRSLRQAFRCCPHRIVKMRLHRSSDFSRLAFLGLIISEFLYIGHINADTLCLKFALFVLDLLQCPAP